MSAEEEGGGGGEGEGEGGVVGLVLVEVGGKPASSSSDMGGEWWEVVVVVVEEEEGEVELRGGGGGGEWEAEAGEGRRADDMLWYRHQRSQSPFCRNQGRMNPIG